jgi:hypothetical protein
MLGDQLAQLLLLLQQLLFAGHDFVALLQQRGLFVVDEFPEASEKQKKR